MKDILTIFLILTSELCFGQKQGNIWYFGQNAGLDFNTGSPISIGGGQTYSPDVTPPEGSSVICDKFGSLLFYSNGQKIWNKNHEIMPNGNNLLGHWSSTQSSIIVPKPGSNHLYYIFTTDAFYQNNLQFGLRYSIVDICLDSGLGDVLGGQKNILLLDTVAEKLTVVRHSNGIDYWILTHKYFSDAFYAYHLTSNGITNTVVSKIGSVHPTGLQNLGSAIGQLKASPNGKKIALVNGNAGSSAIAECFDFDNNTGTLGNCINLQTNYEYSKQHQYYGASFSSDNSKLYITSWLNGNGIYQFDLTAGNGNPDSIKMSKTLISGTKNFYGMQLGPDGKIYVVEGGYGNLGIINFPNLKGNACNFVNSSIDLNGNKSGLTPPSFLDSYDYVNSIYNCETSIGAYEKTHDVKVFPNPFSAKLSFSIAGNNPATVSLYNFFGQQILQETFTNSTTINTGQLPNGIYLYELRNNNGTLKRGKIVKQ